MNDIKKPFGTYTPTIKAQKQINFCQKLSNNWLGKQLAQYIRKKVIKNNKMPLDLTLEKVKMRCYLTDNISERGFVFMPWRYDFEERKQLLEFLPKDGVFIDIGANVGIYSCIAATHLSDNGRVIAIEPNPIVAERLRFNLTATTENKSRSPQFEVLSYGVSDKSGEFDLYLDSKNLGASSLVEKNSGNTIKIKCKTLMQIVEEAKLKQINVIKCDIEGAEDQALVPFLQNSPKELLPEIIIFENNLQQWKYDLLNTLSESGYQLLKQTRLNLVYTYTK